MRKINLLFGVLSAFGVAGALLGIAGKLSSVCDGISTFCSLSSVLADSGCSSLGGLLSIIHNQNINLPFVNNYSKNQGFPKNTNATLISSGTNKLSLYLQCCANFNGFGLKLEYVII